MNDAVMSLAALSTAATYAAQGLRVDGGFTTVRPLVK